MAGLGVASTQIMPPIAALPYIKITAAADTRTDALAKFRETYGGETFTSVEAMCESADVDAIYVATPNPFHAKHVITAARTRKTRHRRKTDGDVVGGVRRHELSGGEKWREASVRPYA